MNCCFPPRTVKKRWKILNFVKPNSHRTTLQRMFVGWFVRLSVFLIIRKQYEKKNLIRINFCLSGKMKSIQSDILNPCAVQCVCKCATRENHKVRIRETFPYFIYTCLLVFYRFFVWLLCTLTNLWCSNRLFSNLNEILFNHLFPILRTWSYRVPWNGKDG